MSVACDPRPRCTGHCCKSFDLPLGPGQLALIAQIAENGDQGFWRSSDAGVVWSTPIRSTRGDPVYFTSPEEALQIARMVRWVGRNDSSLHFYDCKNLTEAGDCSIYETRPTMCRDYPYGNACTKSGCTLGTQTPQPQADARDAAQKGHAP